MILYHGSTLVVESPNVSYSKNYLDFGAGFYLTSFQAQAEKWAKRKNMRYGGKAIVNVFEMSAITNDLKVLHFENAGEEWLNFVCACRRGEPLNKAYDIVVGNVADDDVFKTVDMYFRGLWDKERTLQELRYYKANNQYCFVSQKAVDLLLKFDRSYEVKA